MSRRDANLLGALGLLLADRLAEAVAPAGGASAAEALVTLHARGGGRSIDALARVVGLSHSGTVRLADRLVSAGLAERRRGADQRSTALRLTPAGAVDLGGGPVAEGEELALVHAGSLVAVGRLSEGIVRPEVVLA